MFDLIQFYGGLTMPLYLSAKEKAIIIFSAIIGIIGNILVDFYFNLIESTRATWHYQLFGLFKKVCFVLLYKAHMVLKCSYHF